MKIEILSALARKRFEELYGDVDFQNWDETKYEQWNNCLCDKNQAIIIADFPSLAGMAWSVTQRAVPLTSKEALARVLHDVSPLVNHIRNTQRAAEQAHAQAEQLRGELQAAENEEIKQAAAQALEEKEKAAQAFERTVDKLKLSLPALIPQGYTYGKPRKQKEEEPIEESHLVFYDMDHMDQKALDPRQFYYEHIAPHAKELGIVLVQVSARGHGLHVVGRRVEGMSIKEQQVAFGRVVDYEVDTAPSNANSLMFLTGLDDTTLLDWDAMVTPRRIEREQAGKLLAASNVAPTFQVAPPAAEPVRASTTAEAPNLSAAACAWYARQGGIPAVGERNNLVFRAACCLRYSGASPEQVVETLLPLTGGLSREETTQAVRSAFGQPESEQNRRMYQSLCPNPAQVEEEEEADAETSLLARLEKKRHEAFCRAAACHPAVVRDLLPFIPEEQRPAAAIAMLPILGQYTTHVQAPYYNQAMQTTTIQSFVQGESSIGKSSMLNWFAPILLAPIKQFDAEGWKAKADYDEARREQASGTDKKKKAQLTKPIYVIGPQASNPALRQNFVNLRGAHMLLLGDEIDKLTNASKQTAQDYSVMLREGYDNTETSALFMSADTCSAPYTPHVNILLAGTPAAVSKFLNSYNKENGTLQRLHPILLLKTDTEYKAPTPLALQTVQRILKRCWEKYQQALHDTPAGEDLRRTTLNIPWLKKHIVEHWVKSMKEEAARELWPEGMEALIHRAGQEAFRAGMLWMALEGLTETDDEMVRQKVIRYCEYVAIDKIYGQVALGAGASEEKTQRPTVTIQPEPYAALPDTFTLKELQTVLHKHGAKTPAKFVAAKWKGAGLVEPIERGTYRKIDPTTPATPSTSAASVSKIV